MKLYNKLIKSGFLAKAKQELDEARSIAETPSTSLEDAEYGEDMWSFNSKTKQEEFEWLMHDIEGYEVIQEEYLERKEDELFAIQGGSYGTDFTLLCSVDSAVIESVCEQTLNLSGKIPYIHTMCEIDSEKVYVILYVNMLDFPGFNLN